MRIDSCLKPPGLISSAKMFTLIHKDTQIYLLYTGKAPAFQSDYSKALNGMRLRRSSLDNIAVSALLQKYVHSITAQEKMIDPLNPLQFIHKNNLNFSMNSISDFDVFERISEIRVILKVNGKKIKLDCPISSKEDIRHLQNLYKGSSS